MSVTLGVISSPNHPANYPNNLDRTEIITVDTGKILRLEFTVFAIYGNPNINRCYDFVRITDGDGTTLMYKGCGFSDQPSWISYFQPPIIRTKTNRVEIYFHTNGDSAASGWSLSWTALQEGE